MALGRHLLVACLILGVIVVSCSTRSSYPVTQFGPATYVVYVDSSNESRARRVAAETANRYCQKRGWGMAPSDVRAKRSFNGWVVVYEVQFVFECIAPPEPEAPQEEEISPDHPSGSVPL